MEPMTLVLFAFAAIAAWIVIQIRTDQADLERANRKKAQGEVEARRDKSLPDNLYRIRIEDASFVPVALAPEHWSRLSDFARAGDMLGLQELAEEGKAGLIEPETLARLIGPVAGTTAVEVRLESGPNAGKLVYLVQEALSRDLPPGQENGPDGGVVDVAAEESPPR